MSYIRNKLYSIPLVGNWWVTRKKVLGVRNNTNILVACFPKSGSTYLIKLLSKVTRFPPAHLVQFYGQNEQDLFEHKIQHYYNSNNIIHQHVKGTNNNVMLMKKYNIKPVIQVRNIFDVIPSIHDHIENEDHRIVMSHVHKEYFDFSIEEKFDFLINMQLPWYFSFYISWKEASKDIETLWITYDQLFSDQLGSITNILKYHNLTVDEDTIISSIKSMSKEDTRLNIGKSGRRDVLSDEQKEKIYKMADLWKINPKEMELIGLNR